MLTDRLRGCVLVLLFLVMSIFLCECRSPDEQRRDEARLDSLRQDSVRKMNNPYKFGQGNDQYDRQRETLGNLDSLVTPPQPAIPAR